MARGTFLTCARMSVDKTGAGLRATSLSGACASLTYGAAGELWSIDVPQSMLEAGKLEELEDIVSLIVTTGWRREQWVPVHSAAVIKDGNCAIVCAPTGGGKTTFTAALIRRGWRTLGDDKLLLRLREGKPQLAALLHTFNLHPKTRDWFPEVGELERLPHYSACTEKRKVRISGIWPGTVATSARPTVLILLNRCHLSRHVSVEALAAEDLIATLLRQTVIPKERQTAQRILRTISATAVQLKGFKVSVGTDAYSHSECLAALESALRCDLR